MKTFGNLLNIILLQTILLVRCQPATPPATESEFASVSQVKTGIPVNVQMTAYRTTLIADGKDCTLLRATVIDKDGKEITSAKNTLRIYVEGNAWISNNGKDEPLNTATDTSGRKYYENQLENGLSLMDFHAGTDPGKIKVEIMSDTLWPASHELHTIPSDVVLMQPDFDQLTTSEKKIDLGVTFDVIGISYYPRWHGTLDDLKSNLINLSSRYNKHLNVVEYSIFKKEVHDIVFNLPDGLGTGTCIWEPLGTRWGGMFDENGEVREVINVYDELNKLYLPDEQE